MPAASALRAEKVIAERSRGAHPCVAQLRLVEQPVRHSARHPSRDLSDEGLRLGAHQEMSPAARSHKQRAENPVRGTGVLDSVVRITRAPSALDEDGSMLKARCTDEHQALQHAGRKVRTYRKAVLGLAGLLLLSLCGNLASIALTILVFKESRSADAIPQRQVVLSDSKAAAPVSTSLPTYDTPVSVPGLKRCAVAPSGTEACWELADPAMTVIPDRFLQENTNLTGTLKVSPAVQTISARAFLGTKLTGLDLSEATSLVEIGAWAFVATGLEGTLIIPAKLTKIGPSAFDSAKLTGLDLSKATSLVEIGAWTFSGTWFTGTLVIPATVATIGPCAFQHTKLTGLDLSNATSLVEIGSLAFYDTGLQGTLVIPSRVTKIGSEAFLSTKLTGLDLSDATSLVEIGLRAFSETGGRAASRPCEGSEPPTVNPTPRDLVTGM